MGFAARPNCRHLIVLIKSSCLFDCSGQSFYALSEGVGAPEEGKGWAWEIMGVWASRRFLSWVVGEGTPPQGDQPVVPTGEGTEGKAMEGPRLLNRKTTTPAPTPWIRLSGCSTSAAILLYPHTCLRRRAKFEGVSVWGRSVRQQRSTDLGGTGHRLVCRGAPKGKLRWERWLESHKGTMDRRRARWPEEARMALVGHNSPKGHET